MFVAYETEKSKLNTTDESKMRRTYMRKSQFFMGLGAVGLMGSWIALAQNAPQAPQPMTFFVTSNGLGKGADLGGLAGADAHCQRLATAANAGNRTWRAYLSTQGANGV